LLKRQTFELADRGWDEDCRRLSRALQEAIPEVPQARSFATSKKVILGAVVAVIVLAGVTKFWPSIVNVVSIPFAKQQEKQTISPATLVSAPSGSPAPTTSSGTTSSPAATLLDLGLEGTWRIDHEAGAPEQIQVVRKGSSLILRDPRSSGNGDFMLATVIGETVNLQFAKGPSITATPQAAGKLSWILRVENLPGCSSDAGATQASEDLRHWKGRWVCTGATTVAFDFTAELASDSSALIVTAAQGSRTETVVLHHER